MGSRFDRTCQRVARGPRIRISYGDARRAGDFRVTGQRRHDARRSFPASVLRQQIVERRSVEHSRDRRRGRSRYRLKGGPVKRFLARLRPPLRAGFLELRRSAEDRRQNRIGLTASGKAKCREARSLWQKAQNAFEAEIGATKAARLRRMMADVADFDARPRALRKRYTNAS